MKSEEIVEPVLDGLNKSRKQLVDVNLNHNTLLNFRYSKSTRRTKNLRVVGKSPSEVFRVLVEKQEHMRFKQWPQRMIEEYGDPDRLTEEELCAALENEEGNETHRLQTKLASDELRGALLRISADARSYSRDHGADILYLALGFLDWFESENSAILRKAPLVLIPVSLDRKNAGANFGISYTQIDLDSNLSLANRLRQGFDMELPNIEDGGEDLDVEDYMNNVAERISEQPRWKVCGAEIALGFFSFGQFQMYRDLDPDVWPEGKKPQDHHIVKKLFGNGFGLMGVDSPDMTSESRVTDPTELHLVSDADSTQTEAILSVKRGKNLVIQGPPGTGKSQTITNIIAEALSEDKRVLFVSEKMAALEVVKRNLVRCQLEDTVLELHSHKSNKRGVMEQLRKTLELGEPLDVDETDEKIIRQRLRVKRDQLDDYCNQIKRPILASGTNYVDALGHALRTKREAEGYELPALDFDKMREWSRNDFLGACTLVDEMADRLTEIGPPSAHPFALSELEILSPLETDAISALLVKSKGILDMVERFGCELSEGCGVTFPENITEAKTFCRIAKQTIDGPNLTPNITNEVWNRHRSQIEILITAGMSMSRLKAKNKDTLIEQAWNADMAATREAWVAAGDHWWRIFSGKFRRANQTLQGLVKGELTATYEEYLAIVDDILAYQNYTKDYEKHKHLGEKLFGAHWREHHSDWELLQSFANIVFHIHREVDEGNIPKQLLQIWKDVDSLKGRAAIVDGLDEAIQPLAGMVEELCRKVKSPLPGVESRPVEEQSIKSLKSAFTLWHGQLGHLRPMTVYNRLRTELRKRGLEDIDKLTYDWNLPTRMLLATLESSWYNGLLGHFYQTNPSIGAFEGEMHENVIKEFKKLDEAVLLQSRKSLMLKHYKKLPSLDMPSGEMRTINQQLRRQRGHMPIRQLFSRAGRAIQQIKPVFMMSPMSVATYLKPGDFEFDLVIFDEASQVEVQHALGAILRGKQVVVVGDEKQLPPTKFFRTLIAEDEDEEDNQLVGIQSVLGMFLSKGVPNFMLRWHYRSRHDSLITVSNTQFYNGNLVLFPSLGVDRDVEGLKLIHNPDSVYERGTSRTNPKEAEAVAKEVIKHAKTRPDLTLGVATFSTAQRNRILSELERLRSKPENFTCENFFDTTDQEEFFVKNLENIQGDERDVIFISIGYGYGANGRLSMNFGPLNGEGGERRLNVLITRARSTMKVFSNFTANDMLTTGETSFGVVAFKNFLRYAETRDIELPAETGKAPDSPFEREVIREIIQMGYKIEPQVGSAGFCIDIGVRDIEKPGRYVLGVECDGATYHGSVSARDRDRLRQKVLERLGWQIYRIWSTDWFSDRYKESVHLKEAIERSIRRYKQDDDGTNPIFEMPSRPLSETAKVRRSDINSRRIFQAEDYVLFEGDLGISPSYEIHKLPIDYLVNALCKVVEVEGPIHIKEATKRLMKSAGVTKLGNRILNRLHEAAKSGPVREQFHFEGDFLFHDARMTRKNTANLPQNLKDIDLRVKYVWRYSNRWSWRLAFRKKKPCAPPNRFQVSSSAGKFRSTRRGKD